jgi:hypothetical protein
MRCVAGFFFVGQGGTCQGFAFGRVADALAGGKEAALYGRTTHVKATASKRNSRFPVSRRLCPKMNVFQFHLPQPGIRE